MITILILGAFVALFLRRYYFHEESSGSEKWIDFSVKYLCLQRVYDQDNRDIRRKKRTGNAALVAFYLLWAAGSLYSFLFLDQG